MKNITIKTIRGKYVALLDGKKVGTAKQQKNGLYEFWIKEIPEAIDVTMTLVAWKDQHGPPKQGLGLTTTQRLKEIARIIESVDHRAMACDGDVTPTLQEMTQKEMTRIYELATGKIKKRPRSATG